MQTITLKLKDSVTSGSAQVPVEADVLTPDQLFGKSEAEIKAVKVWWGNKQENAGDLFDVSVSGDAGSADDVKIVFEGNLARVKRIGAGMKAGEIEARGDVDMHVGAMMEGGRVVVKGNANCWAGGEMHGGEILIKGNADRLAGLNMKGGKITIEGDADIPGADMTGGEITVKGTTEMIPSFKLVETATLDGAEYKKYLGDFAMGERKAKGTLYVK
jgi:formylmethanofuran dehydrogenase subunit C